MLQARTARTLTLDAAAGGPAHLSAASGLVRLRGQLAVVADDELHLGLFEPFGHEPGRVFRLFDGDLPPEHLARKAAKPDCEALLVLPPFGDFGHGALMAMGSGSAQARHRGALLALDVAGGLHRPVLPHARRHPAVVHRSCGAARRRLDVQRGCRGHARPLSRRALCRIGGGPRGCPRRRPGVRSDWCRR